MRTAQRRLLPSPRLVFVDNVVALCAIAVLSWSTGLGAQTRSRDGIVLDRAVRAEGLPVLIATNHHGLGGEAGRIVAWAIDHPGPLTLDPAARRLQGATATSVPLSPLMTQTLDRLNQWYGLRASPAHPITHEQLSTAALSPASVRRIRAIFETTIKRGVRVGGKWVAPETGGEATIDEELRLAEALDPRWATVQDLVKAAQRPSAVAALVDSRPVEAALVDAHGLLKVALARFRLGLKGADDEVRRAVVTVAQNAAPTYSLAPEQQLALVTGADWAGRYVGGWHIHAPHDGIGGWVGGDAPSFEDMQNAVQYGQYLTLSFQPDGFDLYDAEPLADAKRVDLALLKVIRYRSASWRAHFQNLRALLR